MCKNIVEHMLENKLPENTVDMIMKCHGGDVINAARKQFIDNFDSDYEYEGVFNPEDYDPATVQTLVCALTKHCTIGKKNQDTGLEYHIFETEKEYHPGTQLMSFRFEDNKPHFDKAPIYICYKISTFRLFKCQCGSKIQYGSRNAHFKTKKHKTYLESLKND